MMILVVVVIITEFILQFRMFHNLSTLEELFPDNNGILS